MKTKTLLALAAGLALASTAHAATSQYKLEYSGAAFNNSTQAFVTFTADDSVINGDAGVVVLYYGDAAAITDFRMELVGTSNGLNGVYDYTGQLNAFFMSASGVDTSTNWVGQAGFLGASFYSPITYATGWDIITTRKNGTSGEALKLTSMIGGPGASQTIPEPSAVALLGLGAVGLVARRRRTA